MSNNMSHHASTVTLTKILVILESSADEWMTIKDISYAAHIDRRLIEIGLLWLCNHGLVQKTYSNNGKIYRIARRVK